MTQPVWHEFASPDTLADALAGTVAEVLENAVQTRGHASLAVSGGRTPVLFFDRLSRCPIPWRKIIVTLVDERFVPGDSPRSNARLVTRHLLQNEAARAGFIGLYSQAQNTESAAREASAALAALPMPLDVAVLGMGTDRHTASFFPDAADIDTLLDAADGQAVRSVNARSAGEPRLTLSMKVLASARYLMVHIEGNDKKEVLEEALTVPPGPATPIGAVLAAAENPAHIYWAPTR
ncbi:6-phosphogluconolactonase [Nitratireductor sp. ZSWI3]|uniref:6-phosphogluconolactonase n=1 Tax=Nitratireductor sp. ZSWI3 TaxID=2966359 RepID=UPI00214F97F6|nr:6-phosphogluconolactonase [Nitratireductor sp. ZSWI3]MCR4268229.1 6-phosphogluconolactonase [Nitratireductor sp. ZSWI3]